MATKKQQILFVKRHQSFGMVKVDTGSFITSEGNVYDFELVKNNYHHYFPPKKQEFLQKLNEIAQESEPSKKCDKNEVRKAYELAQQVDTTSEIKLIPTGLCDYGSMTLYALINDNFISLLQDGDIAGGVDCKEINQIKEIVVNNGIFTFQFLREFDMEKIRNNERIYKYPCLKQFD